MQLGRKPKTRSWKNPGGKGRCNAGGKSWAGNKKKTYRHASKGGKKGKEKGFLWKVERRSLSRGLVWEVVECECYKGDKGYPMVSITRPDGRKSRRGAKEKLTAGPLNRIPSFEWRKKKRSGRGGSKVPDLNEDSRKMMSNTTGGRIAKK